MIETHRPDRIHHHHHHQHYQERTLQVPARKYQFSSASSRSTGRRLVSGAAQLCTRTSSEQNQLGVEMTGNNMQACHQHHSLAPTSTALTRSTRRISLPKGAPIRSRLAFIAITLTFTVSLILLTLAREAHSLNCYTCSSADDPGCDEAFTGRANYSSPEATDCTKYISQPAKVCRKIVQYIEDKKVVIRSCGYIDERADEKKQAQQPQEPQQQPDGKRSICHKRSGTFALMMESCVCYEDLCNHSASLVPDQSILGPLAACSILYFCLVSRRAAA